MSLKRVVVTGIGSINALGLDCKTTWEKISKGISGITSITRFDASNYRSQIAGEVKDFDYTKYFKNENIAKAKKLDPYIHYAQAATSEALEMSGLDIAAAPERIGICVGTGIGGIQTGHTNSATLIEKGNRRVSPFYIPGLIGNTCSGYLSMLHGIQGPNFSVQSACATANHAIITSMMMIQAGQAEAVVAGGAEACINEVIVAGFDNMKALSSKFNATPDKASRPFDVNRDGFVISEGAGVLVLEDYDYAVKRGANILCELLSFGMTGDAYDLVSPDPDGKGAFRAMVVALKNGGLNAEDINYINTHGTSTPLGDLSEISAIHRITGGKEKNLNIGSTKSMTGHLLGATSGLEAVISIQTLMHGLIPPNINIDELDPQIPFTCINQQPVERKIKTALSNSFGFGGHNSTLIFQKI